MATKRIVTKKGTNIVKDTSKLSARQQLKSQKIKGKQVRTTESYKTQRAAGRATAATAIASNISKNEAEVRKAQAQNNENLLNSYLALINGNQSGTNAANPNDTSGTGVNSTQSLDTIQFGGMR